MSKKIVALLLCVFTVILLCACAKDGQTVDSNTTGAAAPETSDTTPTPDTDPSDPGTEPGTEPGTDPEPKPEPKPKTTYVLNSNTSGVKLLGVRRVDSDTAINCDWAGSGFELNVNMTDSGVFFKVQATADAYFRVYVDGVAVKADDGSDYQKVTPNTVMFGVSGIEAGEHNIKVVRVGDHTEPRLTFSSIIFAGTIKTDATPADNALYVEFIGDQLASGKGLNGAEGYDASLGFAYKTAEALKADYSITAMNGLGLLTEETYFDSVYSKSSPKHDNTANYAFTRKADAVVVAFGLNDTLAEVDANEFTAEYLEMLFTIRANNGENCKIYCLYADAGMGDQIAAACVAFGGEAAGVYTVEATGVSTETLPTAEQHAAIATAIAEKINATKDSAITVKPSNSGTGEVFDWEDGKTA